MATKPREMVDTMVLILATRSKHPKDPPATIDMMQRASHLVRQLDVVRVSAIVLVEYLRAMKPQEEPAAKSLLEKTFGEAITSTIAFRATDLLKDRVYTRQACRACLNVAKDNPCRVCGRLVNSVMRINDALIAATADVLDDVDMLYTFDNGVLAFGPAVSKVRIVEPPTVNGPLFDPPPSSG